jgi:hypothetical protein
MINYAQILITNYAGKSWSLNGDDYSGLDWLDSSPKPTQAELDALWESTQATQTAKQEAKAAAKESALSKLTALGLTANEVKALLGVA